MSPTRLLFVYNADSGPLNALFDIGHKIVSPDTYECKLCSLTYGYFAERKQWREFVKTLHIECEFLHRDQFTRRYPASASALPAVFLLQEGQPRACLTAEQIDACNNLNELQEQVRRRCVS